MCMNGHSRYRLFIKSAQTLGTTQWDRNTATWSPLSGRYQGNPCPAICLVASDHEARRTSCHREEGMRRRWWWNMIVRYILRWCHIRAWLHRRTHSLLSQYIYNESEIISSWFPLDIFMIIISFYLFICLFFLLYYIIKYCQKFLNDKYYNNCLFFLVRMLLFCFVLFYYHIYIHFTPLIHASFIKSIFPLFKFFIFFDSFDFCIFTLFYKLLHSRRYTAKLV